MNKYEWIEAVMASKLSTGTKVFAFALFKHMDKDGTCYPGDVSLMNVSGMSRGHFSTYRSTLVRTRWVHTDTRKTKNGDSYFYSIPENAPDGGIQSATDGNESATDGNENAPDGNKSATDGCRNTYINTTNNTDKNTLRVQETSTNKTEPVHDEPSSIGKDDASSLIAKELTDRQMRERRLAMHRAEKAERDALVGDWA